MYRYHGYMVAIKLKSNRKMWEKVSKSIIRSGVEVVKIDGDLIEDIIELRDKKYLDSIKGARANVVLGKVYTLEQVYKKITK
jgi:hypothetical protein